MFFYNLPASEISAQRSSARLHSTAIMPAAYAPSHIVEIICWMHYTFDVAFS